jgi:hypothetical protein
MNIRILIGLGLVALTLPSARALSPIDPHAELRELKTTYEKALSSGDLSPLESLFDANSSGVTVDNQSFHTFAELKAIYAKFHADFPGVVYQVALDAEPSVIEGNLAIARGTAKESVKTSAGEFTYTSTWTIVLRRTDAGWKLVRSQVTMDPFNNSIVTFLQKKAVLTYGLGGIALGLALGVFLGLAFRRRTPTA